MQKVEKVLVTVGAAHCYTVDFLPRDADFDGIRTARIGIDPHESDLVAIDSFNSPH